MFMSEMDDAMLDHGSNMPEETDPHHVDPLEEDLQEISNNFFDFVSKAKQAGSALLEAANRSVLGGPLGDTLAPEPVNNQPAPRHRPIIGVMGSGNDLCFAELNLRNKKVSSLVASHRGCMCA
eukprot:TRINITY_DN11892_c0_g2_i2.p1 TRINITY_DN11892_c0_g2~~TRINITY_DN11892_c0_g2_i2.p1  ORF type:complete len:123 (+),score=24.22 TRINITY_DN11892_c0_g2_i2:208-576(+)